MDKDIFRRPTSFPIVDANKFNELASYPGVRALEVTIAFFSSPWVHLFSGSTQKYGIFRCKFNTAWDQFKKIAQKEA